jgi:membrane protein HdeD
VTRTLARRRTGGDIIVGILLIVAAMVIFGDVVIATVVSVLLLGWCVLVAGVAMVGRMLLLDIRTSTSWTIAFGGVILVVLGLFFVRNPGIGALTLTLLAGSLFLTSGLMRVASASAVPELRGLLIVGGLISVGLGVFVLLNLTTATLTLLGTLLAVQTLIEGITLVAVGRPRLGGGARGRRADVERPTG